MMSALHITHGKQKWRFLGLYVAFRLAENVRFHLEISLRSATFAYHGNVIANFFQHHVKVTNRITYMTSLKMFDFIQTKEICLSGPKNYRKLNNKRNSLPINVILNKFNKTTPMRIFLILIYFLCSISYSDLNAQSIYKNWYSLETKPRLCLSLENRSNSKLNGIVTLMAKVKNGRLKLTYYWGNKTFGPKERYWYIIDKLTDDTLVLRQDSVLMENRSEWMSQDIITLKSSESDCEDKIIFNE